MNEESRKIIFMEKNKFPVSIIMMWSIPYVGTSLSVCKNSLRKKGRAFFNYIV